MSDLKYRIKELFTARYGSEHNIKKAKKRLSRLSTELRVPVNTINYHMNIRATDNAEIPERTLSKYAKFFDVELSELKQPANVAA